MESQARNERREALLWLVGMPLAVLAAAVALLAILSAINPYRDYGMSDLPLTLLLVAAFGLPSALVARAIGRRRLTGWTYFALAGAASGFIGFAALAALLLWAEGSKDLFTVITGATWSKAARVVWLTATLAWPGAIAGFCGGTMFGVVAKWIDRRRTSRLDASSKAN